MIKQISLETKKKKKKQSDKRLKASKFFNYPTSSHGEFGNEDDEDSQNKENKRNNIRLRNNFFTNNLENIESNNDEDNDNDNNNNNNNRNDDKYTRSTFGMTKYFEPNPPKKNKAIDEKIQGKNIEKGNLKFFDETGIRKNDNKHTNLYHDEFDSYKGNYDRPKVISEKLKFYRNDEENIFNKKNRKKDDSSEEKTKKEEIKDQNAEINIRAIYNETETNLFTDTKVDLPELVCPLTYDKRVLEFFRLDLPMMKFFKINIKNRHILKITFSQFSIIYHRYQRIGNFIAQFALYAFFLSIFFTADKKQEILNKKNGVEIGLFILYCLLSEIFSCLLIHLPSFMFYVDVSKLRPIYKEIRDDGGLNIEKDFDAIINHRGCWNFLGVLIQFIYFSISFYFSFCFVATYYYQKKTYALSILVTLLSDILIFEFLWEFILAFLYTIKKKGRCIIYFAEFCNRMRHMKTLT